MKLKSYFKKISETRIKKLASKHRIYYQSDFSSNWLSSQLKDKLSNQQYLKNLIINQLTSKEKNILKKLLTTESINKSSIHQDNYNKLSHYGLIYEQNSFCYLFKELKPLLKNIFFKSTNKEKSETTKKFKVNKRSVSKKSTSSLSFFHYLILSLAEINKLSKNKSKVPVEQNLLSFINQINTTKFKNKKLLNYILDYCHQQNLLSSNFEITDHFYSWVQTAYQEKIISAINTLIPQSAIALRKMIAVLSRYPQIEKIPINFAYQELNLRKINFETTELFKLLNIIEIKNKELSLSKHSWQLFNPQLKFKFQQAKRKSNTIMVPTTIKLNRLWKIAINNQLIAIEDKIIFKSSPAK